MLPRGSSFDYDKLCKEANTRWLRPPEVLFILQNHECFPIEEVAPEKPPSGSLFLFNRRVLRFFRKDGHLWRKKKDGKAIGEAHERLKVGNVDALSCYYAHGEQNPYFQRRSYWMLDPAYDHIVLVHYREVSEGRCLPSTVSQQSQQKLSSLNGGSNVNKVHGNPSSAGEIYDSNQATCSSASGEVNSNFFAENLESGSLIHIDISRNSDPSSHLEINEALRALELQLSLDKCDDDTSDVLPVIQDYEKVEGRSLQNNETGDSFQKFEENLTSTLCTAYGLGVDGEQNQLPVFHLGIGREDCPSWNDVLKLSSSSTDNSAHERVLCSVALSDGSKPSCYTTLTNGTHRYMENAVEKQTDFGQFLSEKDGIFGVPFDQLEQFSLRQPSFLENSVEHIDNGRDLNSELSRFLLGPDSLEPPISAAHLCNPSGKNTSEPNPKVVSICKESIDWTSTIDLLNEKNALSSDLLALWSDQVQQGPSLEAESSLTMAPKQLFRFREISPEWSFSFESTKVIITGYFLCDPSAYCWAVMFGNNEVPAEIVQQGVLRCQAPVHVPGKVTLCVTTGNRESCSELLEFEFRSKPLTSTIKNLPKLKLSKSSEQLLFLVKSVHFLLRHSDDMSVSRATGHTETEYHRKFKAAEEHWSQILEAGCEISSGTLCWIIEELLKDKLQQWLLFKRNGKEDGNSLLSKEEQGIIHMISGLGYDWVLSQILDAGVGINFRDVNGWTALHWAAYFGREKMAVELLAAGAYAGAVTDPTSQDPVGKTAGAIAALNGHKGFAACLSEADLTGHLTSLTMGECDISKGSAIVEAEKAVESISERSAGLHVGGTEDELLFKDYLAAVRNAAQAAARIQAAFRAHSFRKGQQNAARSCDEYAMSSEDIYGLCISSTLQRPVYGYRDLKFDKAALSIQKKYRGWKNRKDFLTLRRNVVKIQAHVRGHQIRKKYKELLWTVGVLEKAVLRWRRKGVGLRGFRPEMEQDAETEEGEEDILKVFRKKKIDAALQEALSRVLSIVESPRARQQYRRMLESYRGVESQAEQGSSKGSSKLQANFEMMQDDDLLDWLD